MLVIQIDVEALEENIKSEIIQDMKTDFLLPLIIFQIIILN